MVGQKKKTNNQIEQLILKNYKSIMRLNMWIICAPHIHSIKARTHKSIDYYTYMYVYVYV